MNLPVNLGTVNVDVPGCSSVIDLTVVGDKLVFSVGGVGFGDLKIPACWLPMIDDEVQAQKLFFEVVEYTYTDEENDIPPYSVFHVYMFVLFDKGTMSGKIHITDDGIHVLSRGDWSEISFIPQGITEWAESPMIIHNRVVYRIEGGTDEQNGCGVAMLVVFEDKFTIFITNLVFYQETQKIEAKQLDLPFPIQSFGRLITSQIDFTAEEVADFTAEEVGYFPEYCPDFFADFTIKIGEGNYNVSISFGAFKESSVDHLDGYYKMSAIYDKKTCTTIFCGGDFDAVEKIPPSAIHHKKTCITFFCDGNEDAFEQMNHEMTRIGIFSIEIPEFVAPETDEYEYSELFDSLTHLPDDLQAFLRSITWRKPKAAGSN
jgi:hypothetical protein